MKQSKGQRLALFAALTADNGTPVNGTAATETLTLAANAVAVETVTVKDQDYTWVAALVHDSPYDVLVGATASDSLDNLIAAVNKGDGEGTLYSEGTEAHGFVTAAVGAGDTMDIASKVVGTAANAYATTETMTQGSWGGVVMSGGVARSGIDVSSYKNNKVALEVIATGTGAQSFDALVWGYTNQGASGNDGDYFLLGEPGANRGALNGGQAITGSAKARHRETIADVGDIDWLYLEVDNLSGTGFSAGADATILEEISK